MTTDELIAGILEREGPGVPPTFLDPTDHGGRTSWGISERSEPEAWRPGPPSMEDARDIYRRNYVAPFQPLFDALPSLDDRVLVALVDDGVLSGVGTSIRTLQRVVGAAVDGVIGPATIALTRIRDNDWLLRRLVQQRAHRLARLVEQDHTQARFIVGWIDRALGVLG